METPSASFIRVIAFFVLEACCFASLTSRYLPCRNSAISLALRSSGTTIISSPALGVPDRPRTSTGAEGPAAGTSMPFSSCIARTRPNSWPVRIISPRCNSPPCTSTVATGPLPLSSLASMTVPEAGPSGTALSSRISAVREMLSSRPSIPSPVIADRLTNMVSPPHSSGITSNLDNSCLTRSGSASGLSILLIATINGTEPALACWIASSVCGITPSSAATTRMTISVTLAPRARIAVNAS